MLRRKGKNQTNKQEQLNTFLKEPYSIANLSLGNYISKTLMHVPVQTSQKSTFLKQIG